MTRINEAPFKEPKQWFLLLLIGWIFSVIGLFLAISMAKILVHIGAPEWIWQCTQAIIFTTVILFLLMYLQKKMQIDIWSFIRLQSFKQNYLYFLLGLMIPIFLVAIGAIIAHFSGLITIQGLHFSTNLILLILLNTGIAFLFEAFPEEVMLRGFLYSTLRLRFGRVMSVFLQTILFVLFPIGVTVLESLFRSGPMEITPDYVILIFLFGISLQLMRLITNNLWTSIGFHLAYLEIARFVVPQGEFSYIDGLSSVLIYDEVEPGIGTVFLLMFMIILMSQIIGGIILFIMKRKGNLQKRTPHILPRE